MKEYDSELIERITRYEEMMIEAYSLMNDGDGSKESKERLRFLVDELSDYYKSQQWKQDFEADENGMLPKDLKRGVLSEDGIYDLIDDYREYKLVDKGYEFCQEMETDKFSLHDCRVTAMEYEDDEVLMRIPDGIMNAEYGDDWPNTGSAAVAFTIEDDDFSSLNLFVEEDGKTVRYEYSLEELAEKINSGEWELEFGYRYEGYMSLFYIVWIWAKEPPYNYEAQLFINTFGRETVLWNKPR